jgi:spore coat protein CotH
VELVGRLAVMLGLGVVACGGGGTDPFAPDAMGPMPDAGPPPGLQVYATDRLHVVAIDVDAQYLDQLDNDVENRVPCTLTFDGTQLSNVGIRKKGGYGSSAPLDDKPGFSIKLNEFAGSQRLDGLKRVNLNNAREDQTFLSEHTGYEAHRLAGMPAPLTAHAVVTFNGADYGIYVVKEPITDDFLDRVFGPTNDQGNVYEGFYHPEDQSLGDFVTHPEELDLKDEVEEMRSRTDVIALAGVIASAPDATFAADVGARFDLDRYVTQLALDIVLGYWDSYAYFLNNYYLYHEPATDRFVYLPHGMDQLGYSELGSPMGVLPQRMRDIPALDTRLDDAIAQVRATWPAAALTARIDQVAAILATAPSGPRTDYDLGLFQDNVASVRAAVEAIGQ